MTEIYNDQSSYNLNFAPKGYLPKPLGYIHV